MLIGAIDALSAEQHTYFLMRELSSGTSKFIMWCACSWINTFFPYGTHYVLAYADDVNLIGDNIRIIEINADVLSNACKDIGLAVNIGKTKYMEIGRHWCMVANNNFRIDSNSY